MSIATDGAGAERTRGWCQRLRIAGARADWAASPDGLRLEARVSTVEENDDAASRPPIVDLWYS